MKNLISKSLITLSFFSLAPLVIAESMQERVTVVESRLDDIELTQALNKFSLSGSFRELCSYS